MIRKSENERALENVFAALRKEYSEEPPARVEASLRTQLRNRRRVRRARIWGAVAAAALASVAFLFATRNPSRMPQSPTVSHAVPPPSALPTAVPEAHRPTRLAAQRAPKSRRQSHRASVIDAGEFISIPYPAPLAPSEQIDIYRVELPPDALAHYGLPLAPGNVNSSVSADVAVGSDGVVRAIRFVH